MIPVPVEKLKEWRTISLAKYHSEKEFEAFVNCACYAVLALLDEVERLQALVKDYKGPYVNERGLRPV